MQANNLRLLSQLLGSVFYGAEPAMISPNLLPDPCPPMAMANPSFPNRVIDSLRHLSKSTKTQKLKLFKMKWPRSFPRIRNMGKDPFEKETVFFSKNIYGVFFSAENSKRTLDQKFPIFTYQLQYLRTPKPPNHQPKTPSANCFKKANKIFSKLFIESFWKVKTVFTWMDRRLVVHLQGVFNFSSVNFINTISKPLCLILLSLAWSLIHLTFLSIFHDFSLLPLQLQRNGWFCIINWCVSSLFNFFLFIKER